MIAINLFHSLVVTDLAELLVIIACCFSIRLKLIRVPAILILISTVIDLFSDHLLNPEVKDFLAATLSVQDMDGFVATLRLAFDSVGESLNILAVARLIIIAARHKLHLCMASSVEPGRT